MSPPNFPREPQALPEENLPPRSAPLPTGFQWGLLALGVILLVGWYWQVGCTGEARWESLATVVVFLGGFLILISLLVEILAPGVVVMAASVSLVLLFSVAVLSLCAVDPFHLYHRALLARNPPKVGIWRYDPLFGFANIPGSQGRHKAQGYDVGYTIDPLGCRVTPDPPDPPGRVTFLGCSFTFGTGVEDDQPFPHLLATRYWPTLKVRNRAVTAYGTSHVYLGLQRELEEPEKPLLVFYGWIPLHRHRNSIRKDWVAHLGRPWTDFEEADRINDQRKQPHFEIENGELVFKGVVGAEDIESDPSDQIEREEAISYKLLVETVHLAAEREVPFILVLFPMPDPYELPDYLTRAIEETDVTVLDARSENHGFLPYDFHPNPVTHAALAAFIAEATPVVEILRPYLERE